MSSKAAFLVRTAASVGSLEEICPSTSTVATEWVWSLGPCFLATTIRAEALLVESGPPGTRRSPVSWSHGLSYIWTRQNAKEILLMGCNEGRPLHERWQCWLELVLNEAPWQERFSKYFAEHRAQVNAVAVVFTFAAFQRNTNCFFCSRWNTQMFHSPSHLPR